MDNRPLLLTCPNCGGKHIYEFMNDFWFLCRDCGYNSPPCTDRETAVDAFRKQLTFRQVKRRCER